MRIFLSLLSLCLLVASGSAFAAIAGTTSPGDFQDTADWCQFGCAGAQLASPQSWTSGLGATGMVGLDGTGQGFYNLQQPTGWNGDFATGMGLIYNGVSYPGTNNPAGIVVTFDSANYGAGAYIQADTYGPFTAEVELYNSLYQPIGTFTTTGTSTATPGTALFIGMIDSSQEVYAAEFWAWWTGPSDPDFAIGTLGIRTEPYVPGVPEPVTFLLLGPALIGMGMLKRRLSH